MVVVENVTGLLTSHGGADFTALCQALADEGYRFGALEIDAARFLPQSRPRMFVVTTREAVETGFAPTLESHGRRVAEAYARLPKRASGPLDRLEHSPALSAEPNARLASGP